MVLSGGEGLKTDPNMSLNYSTARLSEWSKEPDLRPGGISLACSNHAPRKHIPSLGESDKTTIKVLLALIAQWLEHRSYDKL